jgi:CheY-like chemotaxis protein
LFRGTSVRISKGPMALMPKILIVEDTEDTRNYMESVLELEGFDVVVAKDGLEGLEQASSELPDLIITDISMPQLDGFQMIQKLRSSSKQKDVPILAITSYGMDKAMEAIKGGADRALSRPVENHLLVAFVSDLLRKRK